MNLTPATDAARTRTSGRVKRAPDGELFTVASDPQTRVAIVTGGNSGIGRATAVALARNGFDVGITWHRDEERAAATAEEIEAAGKRCEIRHLDLHAVHDGAQAIDELAERLG